MTQHERTRDQIVNRAWMDLAKSMHISWSEFGQVKERVLAEQPYLNGQMLYNKLVNAAIQQYSSGTACC
jgi:hypothetical protein